MHFHPQKCNVLSIEKSKSKIEKQDYYLHGEKLETVTDTKYLGVTLQNNMNFSKHIDNICNKANSMLGLLRRNLKSAPAKTKELGYKAIVRPVLEYASSVWDPHTSKEIEKIEKVQRRAARFVTNNYKKRESVSDMIKTLKWQTLEQRRKKARLSMMYKIHTGQVQVEINRLKRLKSRSGRRGHSEQYDRVECRTEHRNQTFLPRTIRDWNCLDQDTVQARTTATFSLRVAKLI